MGGWVGGWVDDDCLPADKRAIPHIPLSTTHPPSLSTQVYPATTTKFADPLPGDSRDVAALRPLLAQTRLEKAPITLAYDAVKDGWKKGDFHRKVDNRVGG